MKLTREAIQRMISQKQGTSNVTVINQEGGGGGGGVTLGPLLTSLNSEAMPSAEGYLHWSGTAWEWTTPTGGDPVDLTPYALKTWVETNYASKDDISEFITESQAEDLFAPISHTHDNYLPLSAGANKALTGSLYITGSNGIQWAGSPGVGMLCYMPSSGWTGISASQWGVGATSAQGVIRSNANDILHYRNGANYKIWDAYNFTPSDYLPLTGGTVESLTVTNDLDADSITVGSIVNSNTLAEYLDADAMQTWLQQQGYITQTTADGRYIKGVSVYGSSLNPDTNRVVNIPYAGINTPGVIQIGTGLVNDNEGHTTVDTTVIASRQWANGQFVTVGGVQTITGAKTFSGNTTMVGNWLYFKRTTNGSAVGAMFATNVRPQGSQSYVDCLRITGTVDFDNDGAPPMVNGNYLATQEWVDGRYLPLTGGIVSYVNISNGRVGEAVGGIYNLNGVMTLGGESVAVNSDGSFTFNGSQVATQPYVTIRTVKVNGTALTPDANKAVNVDLSGYATSAALLDVQDNMVDLLGTSGDYVTWRQNGTTNNITVPFATDSKTLRNFFNSRPESANNQYGDGKLRHYMATSSMTTGKPPADAHIIHSAWDNTGGYDAQLAIGNSNSGLFFRTQSQGTWQVWKQVAIIDNLNALGDNLQSWVQQQGYVTSSAISDMATETWVTSQLNTLGDNLQSYVTTQLGGYLPLTAGSSKPLTGDLYLSEDLVLNNDKLIYFKNHSGTLCDALSHSYDEESGIDTLYLGFDFRKNSHSTEIYGNELTLLTGLSARPRLVITYGGNVGIGTTTPAAKLDVNGSVKIAGSLTGLTTISTSSRIFAGGDIETKGSFVWCDSQNFGLTIMEGLAVSGDVNYCCALFRHKPQVQLGSDMLEVVVAKSDENGIEFRGSEDGTYTFGYGSGRGDIYVGAGDFTGNLTVGNRPAGADQKLYVGGSAVITGNIGIGTAPISTYAVDVDGSIHASSSVHASSFVNDSDIRMKDITRFIEPSVHDIAIAPIIEFVWKKGDGSKNLGTIAQYWQTVFPQAVHEGSDGMLSIEYANIALASAITAARHSLDNERRIAELELRVAELEDELAAMVSQHSETTDN